MGHLGEQGVCQRSFAGRGAASDEDVASLRDGGAQRGGLPDRYDTDGDVVLQREHRDGGLADREGGTCDDGR